jgi:hypothetical protein
MYTIVKGGQQGMRIIKILFEKEIQDDPFSGDRSLTTL